MTNEIEESTSVQEDIFTDGDRLGQLKLTIDLEEKLDRKVTHTEFFEMIFFSCNTFFKSLMTIGLSDTH